MKNGVKILFFVLEAGLFIVGEQQLLRKYFRKLKILEINE